MHHPIRGHSQINMLRSIATYTGQNLLLAWILWLGLWRFQRALHTSRQEYQLLVDVGSFPILLSQVFSLFSLGMACLLWLAF